MGSRRSWRECFENEKREREERGGLREIEENGSKIVPV